MESLSKKEVQSFFDKRASVDLVTLTSLAKESFIHYTYLEKRRDIVFLIPRNAQLLLDVGCGGGVFEELLFQCGFGGSYKIGIDISKERLKLAHSKRIQNACFICGDAENLPFRSSLFDCMFLIEVVEHTSRKKEVFKELERILKKDGRIIVTTPNKECVPLKIHNMIQHPFFLARLVGNKLPAAVNEYISENELSKMLRETGFQVKGLFSYFRTIGLNVGKVFGVIPPLPPFLFFRFYNFLRKIEKERNFPYNVGRFLSWTIFVTGIKKHTCGVKRE